MQTFTLNYDRTDLIIPKPPLRHRELSSDSLERLQCRRVRSIPLLGSFDTQAILTSLYVA